MLQAPSRSTVIQNLFAILPYFAEGGNWPWPEFGLVIGKSRPEICLPPTLLAHLLDSPACY
jgi:hypothetical protein